MWLSNVWNKVKGWTNTSEGLLNTGWDIGYWQQNRQPRHSDVNEVVESCISCLSQTVAMCPAVHVSENNDGVITRNRGSAIERLLLNPNPYQTRSQFINDLVRSVYYKGNGYAAVIRNRVGTPQELHLLDPRATTAFTNPEDGSIWYVAAPRDSRHGLQFDSEDARFFPARDILNVRINTDRDPLKGVSPLVVAMNSVAANTSIVSHQAEFFNNMSRPSGILTTPDPLTTEQSAQLRKAFKEKSTGENSGEIPVLGNDLKFQAMSLTSQDAQMVEAFGMTVESISRVFRVPPSMINDNQGNTFANAEAAMTWFLSSGLGFLLNHIELELTKLFELPFSDSVQFQTRVLLRQDWGSRINTLGEGAIKAIYSPNEARALEGLPPVKDGDMPRVQQQVVPLDWSGYDTAPMAEPTAEEVERSLREVIKKHAA